ncbi:MAG: hypothetical protein SFY80_17425 [Verrucomicrobiota bacterium]|nr:hypothetical protein [Verrucomicrobiota bacterium]
MSGRIKMLRGNGTKRIGRRKNNKPCPTRQMELARRRRKQKNSTLWQLKQASKFLAKEDAIAAAVTTAVESAIAQE